MALSSGGAPRLGPGRWLVGLAAFALLAGLWAGLVRIGWPWPTPQADLVLAHGPLMVNGVLGVVVSLERAVALGRSWGFGAPLLAGLGAVALVVDLPPTVGAGLSTASGVLLAAVFWQLYQRRPEASGVLLGLGALAWLLGNAAWLLGRPILLVTPWWAGFLVLTIAGERLELAQVLLPRNAQRVLLGTASLVLVGLVVSLGWYAAGVRVAGVGLLVMAAWLLRSDVARRTLRRPGLPRFGGMALLLGYAWLGVAGVLWLLGPEIVDSGFWYDAMLHVLFVGFAFSMVFGHAPTILPAVTGIQVPFVRRFYAPLALLHLSLLLRLLGDLAPWPVARQWGGLLNATALLLFVLLTAQVARGHARAVVGLSPRQV